jgi:nucleoside-diphosphate-sugar epimerase
MNSAIIGHTGFVGSNLIRQRKFDSFYNSQNIESIAGNKFDLIVCSGAPAMKWLANKEPVKDKDNLQRLMSSLGKVSAQRVVLISTVDVYPIPIEVNEDTEINMEILQPYGKHRLELEAFVEHNFESIIVRLPGLFGTGLKKNIIYDFLHNNIVDKIHKDSIFQFYNLDDLWQDIQKSIGYNLELVNFAAEPISVEEVASKAFGFEFTNQPDILPSKYNFKTKYSEMFGNTNGYICSQEKVVQDLKRFVHDQIRLKKELTL